MNRSQTFSSSEDVWEVCHEKIEEQDIEESKTTNIYIAAFTTCWARLHLYKVIDKLGSRVCYMGTDSVVYDGYGLDAEDDPAQALLGVLGICYLF